MERPKAAARSGTRTDLTSVAGEPQVAEAYRRVTEVVGEAIGLSRAQYERARDVIAATEDPDPIIAEVAREAAREMDETGKVRPAFEKVRAAKEPSRKRLNLGDL